jgi:hypothetical protein
MKRTLKQIAETITVNFSRIGFDPSTEQTKFVCIINFQTFDFSCGLYACIPKARKVSTYSGTKTVDPLADLAKSYKTRSYLSNDLDIFTKIQQGRVKAIKNTDNPHVIRVFNEISSLCRPTAYDLLYCLKMDSSAASMSFEDWASDFGYDTDSIKALATYNACCDNAKKLRLALGTALYSELMDTENDD